MKCNKYPAFFAQVYILTQKNRKKYTFNINKN